MLVFYIVGVSLTLAFLCLWLAKRQDRKNFVYQRAPRMPVKLLSDHDDAWLFGKVEQDEALLCPYFAMKCVYYDYQSERKVTRRSTDSEGNTRTTTSWETEDAEHDVTPFWLVDVTGSIRVQADKAEFKHVQATGYAYQGFSLRHSATYLGEGETVSVLGVKDSGEFGPMQEIPLLITAQEPEAFLKSGDTAELVYRFFAFFFLFAGGFAGAAVFTEDWVWSGLIGFGALIPLWFVSTYNQLVRQRQQTEAAWRQIDVDLAVRNGVIPKIVAVCEGYRDYERQLFENIASLRSSAVADDKMGQDRAATMVVRGLLALEERHPELAANTLFMDLHGKLWALEEKLAASRTFYNKVATEWNKMVERIPTVVVATLFRWGPRKLFETLPAHAGPAALEKSPVSES